ncbi:MAG: ATP-binding cassette domain-containing protein, partial [Alphaproteobacteria bacterium]
MSVAPDQSQAVEMQGISMHFGSLVALDNVDLSVRAGEVHALLGGNGAGKSTLLKILNGVHRQTAGEVAVFGTPFQGNSPELARAAGVAMNFQEMSLIPSLTVAQNIFLNHEFIRNSLINEAVAIERASDLFEQLNVEVDPRMLVSDLSPGQRQLTEIAKSISHDARVWILDEPSTALS